MRTIKAKVRKRKYEISRMWNQHHTICRLHVLGISNINIAEQLGISQAMVSYTLNSQLGQLKVRELQQKNDANTVDIGKRLLEAAADGQTFLEDIVRGAVPVKAELRARVCQDQLSRAGYSPIMRSVELNLTPQITGEDLVHIMQDLEQASNHSTVVDTTYKESSNVE